MIFFFPLHCKDIAHKLILFPLFFPLQPLQLLQCIVDEVRHRLMCFPLLKSSLMVWKAYILFPNEAQCPTSSKQVMWYALSWVT